ncbi:hypothetical protein SO802_004578 [Lithocarpus litseifolius]|uniref:Uncharacterized protein n=1 Tax=Lithocarpus litseifolius TaxID=425828 RepID=A0AAW2E556_9ROSI
MDSEISEIEKADSPLELCDFLYLELEKLRKPNLEIKDPRSQSHSTDRLPWPSKVNKLHVFFWHAENPIMYGLYEIEVPKLLPPPPTTEVFKDVEIRNLSRLKPILLFETGIDVEICTHLFFKCPVARAIWFASRWGLKLDNAPVNSCEDIIKMVTKPLKHGMYGQQHNKEEILKLSLYLAYNLDAIWNLRNQILHNGGQANIIATARNIENRFQELASAMISENPFRVEGDQEKKAKAGLIGGILPRKRQRENEPSKEEIVVTSFMAKSQDRRPASPTSSLQLIVSSGGGSKAKATSKVSIAFFWEDARTAA